MGAVETAFASPTKPGIYEGLPIERWLPVIGFEGLYAVSDAGRVRSEARTISMRNGCMKTLPARIKIPSLNAGYPQVMLYRGNVSQSFRVHRLVLARSLGRNTMGWSGHTTTASQRTAC